MVQLFPSTDVDVDPALSEGQREKMDSGLVKGGGPKLGPPGEPGIQPLNQETFPVYHGYDAYIENGLICLRHKVRNLEKKKVRR